MSAVDVELALYKHPCQECAGPFWWVLWMRAVSPEPDGWEQSWPGGYDDESGHPQHFDMPVAIDQPSAVRTARMLLDRHGQNGRAGQLVDRPPGLRGASYNANRCPQCHDIADWHYFEDSAVIDAAHNQNRLFKIGPVPLPLAVWVAVIADQHVVRGFWPTVLNPRTVRT